MTHPTLYSLTSNNLTQSWRIEVSGSRYRTHEGIVDGAITTSSWTTCASKNISRVNETSPEEQAIREAAAKHKKKIESGYHENIDDIAEAKFFEPMLAKKWQDYKDEVTWPVYSSAKLDGLRCIISRHGMFSRNGKSISSAPHIWNAVKDLFVKTPSLVLDGELYAHKLKHDFNRIISLAKKVKPTEQELAESAKTLEYWVYDCVYEGATSFTARLAMLKTIFDKTDSCVKVLEQSEALDNEQLDRLYSDYMGEGYEGQMIRWSDSSYENKRTKYLLKRKEMSDAEFLLLDLEEGRGNLTGIAARAILQTKAGIQFEAGMIGSHEYCADLLRRKNEVIGKMATVVFQNLTPDGKPRFGKLKEIRNYE